MSGKFAQCSAIYVHGFATGPVSTKTEFMREHLEALGCPMSIPDLNGGSFERMTLTSQLQIVEKAIDQVAQNRHLLLFGSGMGAVLATIKSQQLDRLRGMVLLSPGFGIVRRWTDLLGTEMLEEWRTTGGMEVHHYAEDRELPLSYKFWEDAQRYQTEDLKVTCPTLVFHGKRDEVIPAEGSKKFAKQNPKTVEFHLLDDSDMVSSLDLVWEKIESFIERVIAVPAR